MSPEDKDKQILALLFLNSRASLRDIGREVELGATSVRARINRLIASGGIIRFAIRVNPVAFGFTEIAFLTFRENEIDEETRRATRMVGKPFAQGETIDGETCLLKALTMADGTLLGKLKGRPNLVGVSEVGMKRNLSANGLSTTDLLIIRCLLSNPRAHIDEIAECASVTSKTVSHRLESMLQERVLAYRVDVDSSKMSFVEGYVFVELGEGLSRTTLDEIDEALEMGMLYTSNLRFDREMVVAYYCARDVFDVGPVLKRIRSLEGVLHVTTRVFSRLTFLHDWISEEIDARIGLSNVSLRRLLRSPLPRQ